MRGEDSTARALAARGGVELSIDRPTDGATASRAATESRNVDRYVHVAPGVYLVVYLVCICSEAGYARICAYLMRCPAYLTSRVIALRQACWRSF